MFIRPFNLLYFPPFPPTMMTLLTPTKLDAGSEEKVMLVSRDDTSCLVVSYKEIKACMEGAFRFVSLSSIADKKWLIDYNIVI